MKSHKLKLPLSTKIKKKLYQLAYILLTAYLTIILKIFPRFKSIQQFNQTEVNKCLLFRAV